MTMWLMSHSLMGLGGPEEATLSSPAQANDARCRGSFCRDEPCSLNAVLMERAPGPGCCHPRSGDVAAPAPLRSLKHPGSSDTFPLLGVISTRISILSQLPVS